ACPLPGLASRVPDLVLQGVGGIPHEFVFHLRGGRTGSRRETDSEGDRAEGEGIVLQQRAEAALHLVPAAIHRLTRMPHLAVGAVAEVMRPVTQPGAALTGRTLAMAAQTVAHVGRPVPRRT